MRFSIRKTILLGLGLSTMVFIVCFVLLQRFLLQKSFADLERVSVTRDVERARNAVVDELNKLDDTVIDWAIWDDTFHFMQGADKNFIAANLNERSITALRLAVIAFVNNDGDVIWAQRLAPSGAYDTTLLDGLTAHLKAGCPLLAAKTAQERVKGLLRLPQGLLLTASCPILDSEGRGPKQGTLIMGRLLDQAVVAALGQRIALSVRLDPVGAPLPPALARLSAAAPAVGATAVTPLSRNEVAGQTVMADLDGRPALRVIVRQPRDVLARGQTVMAETGLVLLVGGGLLALLLFVFLERRVLARLAGLTRQVGTVAAGEANLGRVSVVGDDELAGLAGRINAMLAEVEAARQANLRRLDEKQAQEASLRQILDSIQAGVILVDARTWRVEEINRFAADAAGRSRDAILGQVCPGLLCPEEPCRCPMENVRVLGLSQYWLLRADGSKLPILKYASCIQRDGRDFFLETFIDIHELQEARAALVASEIHLQRIIDTLPIGIYQASPEGRCTLVNPSLAHFMGYADPVEMLATDPDIPHYYLDKDQFLDVKRTLETEGAIGERSVSVRRIDGRVIWVTFSCLPVRDAAGALTSYIGYVQDITRRREAELELKRHRENLEQLVTERTADLEEEIEARQRAQEELLQAKNAAESANKSKSAFLANMSHEIRTPLNGVLGMLQLLADTPLDADQKECLDAAALAANRLTDLLSDILDLSRVEADKLTLIPDIFPLAGLRQSVLALFQTAAWKKGLKLLFTLDEALPETAVGDEARLRQILFNLVGNALKFTDAGEIRVAISPLLDAGPDTMRLLFTVGDTGIGISDDHVATIFNPFVQAEQSATRVFQGAGLGLAIVRKLVGLMGGNLAIDNGGDGRGTVFYIELPLGKAAPDAATVAAPASVPTAPRPGRILVVEDDPVSCNLVDRWLTKAGFTITTAGNGRDALRLLGEHPFDLVLMDIQLPVLNGLDATRTIRASALPFGNSRIPIIAMTAYAMAGDREAILATGMNAYVAKPIELAPMLDLIGKVLESPGAFPPGGAGQ